MVAHGVTGTKWSLHLHFKKTEVLGDPPDTNNIIVQLTKEETEVKREGKTCPASQGDRVVCLACQLPVPTLHFF